MAVQLKPHGAFAEKMLAFGGRYPIIAPHRHSYPRNTALVKPLPRLRLQGFNNLTKSLSFNIYDICYAASEDQRQRYIEYIDEVYNAERLTQILTEVANIIGANILNVARQDYDPQGASVTILISEEPVIDKKAAGKELISDAVVAHLDKSHITVHTYPETHPHNGIATFRADIDVATCGVISPLKALNYLIESFDSDIVVTDYNMPGMSGLDVAREVRTIRADLPVAVASGFIDEALRAQAEGAGVRELVFKASALEDLCDAFARMAQAVATKA